MAKTAGVLFLALLCAFSPCSVSGETVQEVGNEIVIWAWERAENLLFLKDGEARVAFYAGIIAYEDSKTFFTPRRQPLVISSEVPLTALFRIENRQDLPPASQQAEDSVRIIAGTCENKEFAGVQIDFDARSSERGFYRNFIRGLRRELPPSTALSITALASWSHSGSWIESLPLDEAVPMLFRMGADGAVVRKGLAGESFMQASLCRKSAGVSLDEPLPHAQYLQNRKIYIFNPVPWTGEDFEKALIRIESHIKGEDLP